MCVLGFQQILSKQLKRVFPESSDLYIHIKEVAVVSTSTTDFLNTNFCRSYIKINCYRFQSSSSVINSFIMTINIRRFTLNLNFVLLLLNFDEQILLASFNVSAPLGSKRPSQGCYFTIITREYVPLSV